MYAAVAIVLLVAASAQAQLFSRASALPPADVEEFDSNAATHLENAKRFLAEKQWDDAVDAIRRVMESDSGKFARISGGGNLPEGFAAYVPLREYCQRRLAALHRAAPEALSAYRKLVDPLAETWYRDAIAERNETLLQRIVEQAFASRWGDDALLKLGELALARGDYVAARGAWQRIAPFNDIATHVTTSGDVLPATYPDTDLSLADVHARLVLTSILEGTVERASKELEQFRSNHATATGTMAGRDGMYVDLLDALLAQSKAWPAPRETADWTTLAGNVQRNKIAAADVDIAGAPLWSFPLPQLKSDRDLVGEGRLRVADDMNGLLSYFPVVVGQTVLLRVDARRNSYVAALDLRTGKPRWQVDYPRSSAGDEEPLAVDVTEPWRVSDAHAGLVRHIGVARYTLASRGAKLFARMGSPVTAPQVRRIDQTLAKDQGWLLGLDLRTEGKPLDGFPLQTESAEWAFEGTPVADEGNIYVAMRHMEGSRSQLHVACFALQTTPLASSQDRDTRATGRMRWRTKVAAATTLGAGDVAEISHNLLTLDHGVIYCNTNLGAVAALTASDGRVRWLMKYPRGMFRSGDPDKSENHFFRDLNPCLIAGDLIVVAPSDCPRIFAIKAATGELAWTLAEGTASDAVHLLGVGGGHLIVSGEFLYWIDVHSGRLIAQYPRGGPSSQTTPAPSPRGFGRGVLTGSHIYWPTRQSIIIFQQRPQKSAFGWQPQGVREIPLEPRGVTGGNLTIARGILLIATGDRLYAFSEVSPKSSAAAVRPQ